jgi:hypothetical protein
MSKSSKNAQALIRKKEKRAKKERQQAVYDSYKLAGTNQKSKRTKLANKRSMKVGTKSHPDGACFNHGCERCQPELNSPFNAGEKSCIFGKQWSSPKHR